MEFPILVSKFAECLNNFLSATIKVVWNHASADKMEALSATSFQIFPVSILK